MFSGNFLSPVLISLKYRFSQSLMLSDKLAVMVQILDVYLYTCSLKVWDILTSLSLSVASYTTL